MSASGIYSACLALFEIVLLKNLWPVEVSETQNKEMVLAGLEMGLLGFQSWTHCGEENILIGIKAMLVYPGGCAAPRRRERKKQNNFTNSFCNSCGKWKKSGEQICAVLYFYSIILQYVLLEGDTAANKCFLCFGINLKKRGSRFCGSF